MFQQQIVFRPSPGGRDSEAGCAFAGSVLWIRQHSAIERFVASASRMAIADQEGVPREALATKALDSGVLADLQKRFQTRIYRLDTRLTRVADTKELPAISPAPATHIGDGLKQFAVETSDLPIGAVVLLSDGSDNSGGIDADTISALRNRRIPVHTVGFGLEQIPNDVEINDAVVAQRALADSRLSARVSFHQRGYAGRKVTLTVRDGSNVLASRDVTLRADDKIQTEALLFNAGPAGAKTLQFHIDPLLNEQNQSNNTVARLVNVESGKRRVLYVEGEPRWEYKFIRRAEDDDRIVQVASMLRTTENKIYRQGITDPKELAEGFPARAEDLFGYQGVIFGSVEAGYFTPPQQELIREFVDRRGGGVLFLGGRFGLADGGWAGSNLADLIPTTLPSGKSTFHRDPATVELTQAGDDSIVTRLIDDPVKNIERWKKLAVFDGLSGSWNTEAGCRRAGGDERQRAQDALRGDRKLWTRPASAIVASGGIWRWQNEPTARRHHSRYVLAAGTALAGYGFPRAGGGFGAESDAV